MNVLELSEQEILRRQSLDELRKMGINPYPAAEYPVTAWSTDIISNFEDLPVIGKDEEGNECENMLEFLECYDSLLAATASTFFPYFMELDHLTDKKVAEVLNDINDTRNYPYRCGTHWTGGNKPEIYIEMFNTTEPERREY